MLEKFSMNAIAEKLGRIGGSGKLSEREWRIRCRLGWHSKASSAIRHLIYGERKPSLAEVQDIEAAHLKYCAEKIEANREETAELFRSMQQALAAMQEGDADFYRPHIEAIGELLLQGRNPNGPLGKQN